MGVDQKQEQLWVPDVKDDTKPGHFLWDLFKIWLSAENNTLEDFLKELVVAAEDSNLKIVKSANSKLYGKVKTDEADAVIIIYSALRTWPDSTCLDAFICKVFDEKSDVNDAQLVEFSKQLARDLFNNTIAKKILIEAKSYRSPKEFFVETGQNSASIIIPTPSEMINQFSGWRVMKDMRELMSLYLNEADRNKSDEKEQPKYIWLLELKKPPRTEPDEHFYAPYHAFLMHISSLISWCSIEWHRDFEHSQNNTSNAGGENLIKWRKLVSERVILYVKNLPFPFRTYSLDLVPEHGHKIGKQEKSLTTELEHIRNLLHDLDTNWDLIPKKIPEAFIGRDLEDKVDSKRTQLLITSESTQKIKTKDLKKQSTDTIQSLVNSMELKYWLSPYEKENSNQDDNSVDLPNIFETKEKPVEALDKAYRCIFQSADCLLNNDPDPDAIGYQFTEMLCDAGWYPLRVVDLLDVLKVPGTKN